MNIEMFLRKSYSTLESLIALILQSIIIYTQIMRYLFLDLISKHEFIHPVMKCTLYQRGTTICLRSPHILVSKKHDVKSEQSLPET